LAGDDVEVVDDGGAAQVEQVLAGAQVAGAAALPVADMGQAVLDLGAFTQSRATLRGLLPLAELDQQGLVRVDGHLRPVLLVVQRTRSGQAAQAWVGKWTRLPGAKAITTSLGQVSCQLSKSMRKSALVNRPALPTRHALQ
jgi:hypothetical protein